MKQRAREALDMYIDGYEELGCHRGWGGVRVGEIEPAR